MPTKTEVSLNQAVQLMLEAAQDVGQMTGKSPIELLVFAATSALATHMNRTDALTQFDKARQQLVSAGLDEKK